MWLIFLLIWNFILFSQFSISSCALPIDTTNNKDANLNTNINNKDSVISSKGNVSPEGSGSVPANEILSDDEDFFPGSLNPDRTSDIDFSGDGPINVHLTNNNNNNNHNHNNNGHIVTNPDSHDSTSINSGTHNNHGDDEDDTEDEEDDEDDDEGSGDSSNLPSSGKIDPDGNHFGGLDETSDIKTPTVDKPDSTNIQDIIIDGSSKSSDPILETTSSRPKKPPIDHDIDHSDDDHDHDDLDDNDDLDNEDDEHDQNENTLRNDISILGRKQDSRPVSFFAQPSMLAAVIGGIVVSLLCAILLAMFIIYRARKKDEGSYICEPSLTSPVISHYGKGSSNKFYDP